VGIFKRSGQESWSARGGLLRPFFGIRLHLDGLWGKSGSDLYIVGDNGAILHKK